MPELTRLREAFSSSDNPQMRWLHTTSRLKSIQTSTPLMQAGQLHLSCLGERAKLSPRSSWLSASVPEIRLPLFGYGSSALHTCTSVNMKKPSNSVAAR
jgi:hypothetical protein